MNQRINIRNAHLISSTIEIRQAMESQDETGKKYLQEMLNECYENNVDNFGEIPCTIQRMKK